MVPQAVTAPRGAQWAARTFCRMADALRGTPAVPGRLRRIGLAIWNALERVGQRRAADELERLAHYYAPFDPARARAMRELVRSIAPAA